MLNDTTIIAIANAITANAQAIQSLLDHLPVAAKEQVAKVITVPKSVPTPTAPATVTVTAAPAPVVPVVESPSNVMPPPPMFTAPVAPTAPTSVAPFSDSKGLLDYMMDSYRKLGPQKGAGIQSVLQAQGYANVNDVKPEKYAAIFAGIEALK